MIPAQHSLFAGGPLPPKLSPDQGENKRLRDAKWNSSQEVRAQMSAAEKQIETERLEFEIKAILAERSHVVE